MSDENVYQAPSSDLGAAEETGELVYAGFWVRVLASIIDGILMAVVTTPLAMAIYGEAYWSSDEIVHGTWDILVSYVLPAVATVLFWVYKSATPGKMMLGLKVIHLGEKRQLNAGQAVLRYIGYFPSLIVLCLGFIWVAFDARKQGWHDKLANTAVVKV